jgi:hypothetical protein
MVHSSNYLNQIIELLEENGWGGLFEVTSQEEPGLASGESVQIKLGAGHPTAPGDLVNIYTEGVHPLEQIQQECLRSLRTGRPGI